jgi:hypothetical protein
MYKEPIMTIFNVLHQYLFGVTEENNKNLSD